MAKDRAEIRQCGHCGYQVIIGYGNYDADMAQHMRTNHPGRDADWRVSYQETGPERVSTPEGAKAAGGAKAAL